MSTVGLSLPDESVFPPSGLSGGAVRPHSNEILELLDDPQEWSAFSRPSSMGGDCWESSVVIEGMHCAACSLTVEEALSRVPGVMSAQVGAASHRAKVVWSAGRVNPSAWMKAVQHSGYRAVPANDVFASERRKLETRQALWRWLVAGLCMMQVMMYAYPALGGLANAAHATGHLHALEHATGGTGRFHGQRRVPAAALQVR